MSKPKKNKTNTNSPAKTTPVVKTESPVKAQGLSLAEANEQGKILVSNKSVGDIVDTLKANKGQVMTAQEIGVALGTEASRIRHKMQKQGLSARQGTTVEIENVWVHLRKLDGGMNGYKVTPIGQMD